SIHDLLHSGSILRSADDRSSARPRTSTGESFYYFNDTATTEIYTLSLHDALPISTALTPWTTPPRPEPPPRRRHRPGCDGSGRGDRKSTRLNSSHSQISYAVFCLKKKKATNKYSRSLPRC